MPATLKTNYLGNVVSGATCAQLSMGPIAEAYTFSTRMINSKTSFRSPGFFKRDDLLM